LTKEKGWCSKTGIGLVAEITETLSELKNSGKLETLINEALSSGIPANEIIEKGLRRGLDSVGQKYENSEYFLADLLYAGDLMTNALKLLEPHLKLQPIEKKGDIVLGTVSGDIHDIGKNIFKMLAVAAGFEAHDLGVDVEASLFVGTLKERKTRILGISSLLSTTRFAMKAVIDELTQAGIRDQVKVLLGGNAVTKQFGREIGADAAALDAVEGVQICLSW
jgi:dimethylamine corrinoid protein